MKRKLYGYETIEVDFIPHVEGKTLLRNDFESKEEYYNRCKRAGKGMCSEWE